MKKLKLKSIWIIILIIFTLMLLTGCLTTTANNAKPQNVLKANPNADYFIMNNTVYMNVADIDWVKELALKEGKVLGKINKTGVKQGFQNWNATKLSVDTLIYELEGRDDIVLIKIDNKYIPYLKYVEG